MRRVCGCRPSGTDLLDAFDTASPEQANDKRHEHAQQRRSAAAGPCPYVKILYDAARYVELVGDRTIAITYNKDRMNAGEVLSVIQGLGLGIIDVTTKEADLEDVFLRLTSTA